MRQRIMLGVIAGLFIVSSIASVIVIYLAASSQDAATTPQPTAAENCSLSQPAADTLEAPQAYIPPADVTALETTDLVAGTGAAVKSGDCAVMKYYGSLAKDGTLFDENYTKPTAFPFVIGGGVVIQGWDRGVAGMKVGGKRRLVIPAELAYAERGACNQPDPADPQKCLAYAIPPNADIVFEVVLVAIKK